MKKKNTRIHRSKADLTFDVTVYIVLGLLLLIVAYPLWFVIIASVSDPAAVSFGRVILLPKGFSLEGYRQVITYPAIWRSYLNTIVYTLCDVALTTVITVTAGYALSRRDMVGKNIFVVYMTITMFFSGGMIPFYFVVKNIGLENSLWSLVLPVAVNTFNLMILRVSFASVPTALEESAYLDGVGHFTMLFKIILPISKASIAVIGLYYAVNHWNSWFNAMLFLNDRNKYPLQLILREILINSDTSSMTMGAGASELEYVGETIKYAVIIISTLPILCVYPFIQKYFAKGVMVGAVKG